MKLANLTERPLHYGERKPVPPKGEVRLSAKTWAKLSASPSILRAWTDGKLAEFKPEGEAEQAELDQLFGRGRAPELEEEHVEILEEERVEEEETAPGGT